MFKNGDRVVFVKGDGWIQEGTLATVISPRGLLVEVDLDVDPLTTYLAWASDLTLTQDDRYMALTKSAVDRESLDRPEAAPALPPASDPVTQPSHYARYVIEPISFIMANKLPFAVGNVVKYVLRYDAKNGREDLMKARRYIDMILEGLDRDERVAAGEDAATTWARML